MGRRFSLLMLLLIFLISISTPSFSSPVSPIVYVDTDGSGDYNCDGTDDHIQLNKALSFINSKGGGTVYLNGPNTYWISDTVLIGDHTTLTGDPNAVIKLVDDVGWPQYKPMIGQKYPDGNHHIIIHGFEIDGNSQNQDVPTGTRYHMQIWLYNSNNVDVHNMYMHDGKSDFIRIEHERSSSMMQNGNFTFHDNILYKSGHDAISFVHTGGATVYNNDITTRTNAGVRLTTSDNVEIFNNTIHSDWDDQGSATGPAIQIQMDSGDYVENVEIHDNTIYDIVGSGIWMDGEDDDGIQRGNDVYIHHNTFTRVGQYWTINGYSNSGIVLEQFNNTIIENNVFDDCGRSAISHITYDGVYNSGWTTVVRNNVIMNSQLGTGIAIYNGEETTHSFITENNCFYNVNEIYSGENIYSFDDICADPLFVDPSNRDYHPKSTVGSWSDTGWRFDAVTSPLIDAGHSRMDYSNEPEPNGNRINIGRYGNTVEASRGASVQPIAFAGSDLTVNVGEIVTLDGSASTDDIGIVSHVWDLDNSDGLQQDATGAVVQHSYDAAGIYVATLKVSDAEGRNDHDEVNITVNVAYLLWDLNEDGDVNILDIKWLARIVSLFCGGVAWS